MDNNPTRALVSTADNAGPSHTDVATQLVVRVAADGVITEDEFSRINHAKDRLPGWSTEPTDNQLAHNILDIFSAQISGRELEFRHYPLWTGQAGPVDYSTLSKADVVGAKDEALDLARRMTLGRGKFETAIADYGGAFQVSVLDARYSNPALYALKPEVLARFEAFRDPRIAGSRGINVDNPFDTLVQWVAENYDAGSKLVAGAVV